MNESLPKVSIVLPTYNGAKYIRQSIDSCLNQIYKNIELIIVDDGSTDKTAEIIKSYKDERIKYIWHKKNRGLPNALNTGFANATGEYLTWTSDDNFYLPEAIKTMVSYLQQSADIDFVYSDFIYHWEDENREERIYLPSCFRLNEYNHIGGCFLYKRKVYESIGDYDCNLELCEDYDYWLRVSKRFNMFHIDEPLYIFARHYNSLTSSRFIEVRAVELLTKYKNKVIAFTTLFSLMFRLLYDLKKRDNESFLLHKNKIMWSIKNNNLILYIIFKCIL